MTKWMRRCLYVLYINVVVVVQVYMGDLATTVWCQAKG